MADRTHFIFRGRRGVAVVFLVGALPLIGACQTTSNLDKADIAKAAKPKIVVTPQLVEMAETALIEGRLKTAREAFSRILAAEPKNTDAKIGLGEVFLALGDWKKAHALYRDLAAHDSLRAIAYQGQGHALLIAGKADAAKHMFQQALQQDKTLWRAWNGLGQSQDRRKEFADAERSYRRALELSPKAAVVHNNLGYSMLLHGRHAEAESQFLMALNKDPGMKIAQSNLRLVLAWQGRYFEAMSGTPIREKAEVLNNVGFIAMLRGDYGRAEAYLTRAMDGRASFYDVAWRNMEALRALAPRRASGTAQTSMITNPVRTAMESKK